MIPKKEDIQSFADLYNKLSKEEMIEIHKKGVQSQILFDLVIAWNEKRGIKYNFEDISQKLKVLLTSMRIRLIDEYIIEKGK